MPQDQQYLNRERCDRPPIVTQRTNEGYLLSEKIESAQDRPNPIVLIFFGIAGICVLLIFSWFFLPLIFIQLLVHRPLRQRIRAAFFLLPGELIVSQYPLHLGSSDRVKFRRRLKGNRKLTANGSVKIKLFCIERVGYTQGTDTIIETAIIEEKLVRSQDIMSGVNEITCQFDIEIPAHLPPSFEAKNNQIRWVVVVEQNMPGIADIDSNYTLLVER